MRTAGGPSPDVSLPDGCVVVGLHDCEGPDGRQLVTVPPDRLHMVVRSPSDFRVVPHSMVEEYAVLCRRHEIEVSDFWARVIAAPSFKVTVSLTA